MKICSLAVSMVACLGLSCSSMPRVMSPKVDAALRAGELGFPIRTVRAYTHWLRDYGKGLAVEVWVARDPAVYSRDLQLELDGAAVVLAALARSPLSVEWDFVDVRFFNDYGKMPPRGRVVCGVARVVIRREAIMRLRAKGAPPPEYSRSWKLVGGYKDQPDSKVLLRWKDTCKP